MTILATNGRKSYESVTIVDTHGFSPPFAGIPFPCLIWDHTGGRSETERANVAKALLLADCRYAVCAGADCSAWELAVDMEFVTQHLDASEEFREAVHVMTTSHESESPDDVAFFFVLNTNFDEHEFERYLVLHVGTGPLKERVDAAVREYALQ